MRILHIIPSLALGGAETLLYALCSVWARDKNNEHIIISFTDDNCFDFDKLGIPYYICPIVEGPRLHELWCRKFEKNYINPTTQTPNLLWQILNLLWRILNLPRPILNLRRKIKTIQPDIIKAWIYPACFFTHLTASAKIPQIWGIHNEKLHSYDGMGSRLLAGLLARLQTDSKPRKIIFTSNTSMKHHLTQGYAAEKAILMYNGVDMKKFSPSQKMRIDKRKELGIEEDIFLIGNFSRFHKVKNYPLLANIFAEVLKKHGKTRLVLAGRSMDSQNTALMALFSDAIFQGKILFLGARYDMNALFNALDCYVLTSHSEVFPMVLLEAAACGVPAIANNVGDVSQLILDKQFVIDSGEVQDFVDGIEKIMSWSHEESQRYADKSRQRMQDNFSIETTAEKYMNVFKQALE